MDNPWNAAADALPGERDLETIDQKIAYAQACALLSIGQELSRLNYNESPFTEYVTSALGAIAEGRKG
jgi:hypothetical protein